MINKRNTDSKNTLQTLKLWNIIKTFEIAYRCIVWIFDEILEYTAVILINFSEPWSFNKVTCCPKRRSFIKKLWAIYLFVISIQNPWPLEDKTDDILRTQRAPPLLCDNFLNYSSNGICCCCCFCCCYLMSFKIEELIQYSVWKGIKDTIKTTLFFFF